MSAEREIWIGLVELRPLSRREFGSAGAFTYVVMWAKDRAEFRAKAEMIASTLQLYVLEIQDAEPISEGLKSRSISEELEDLVERAKINRQAILYGTLHRYRRDNA